MAIRYSIWCMIESYWRNDDEWLFQWMTLCVLLLKQIMHLMCWSYLNYRNELVMCNYSEWKDTCDLVWMNDFCSNWIIVLHLVIYEWCMIVYWIINATYGLYFEWMQLCWMDVHICIELIWMNIESMTINKCTTHPILNYCFMMIDIEMNDLFHYIE